MVPVCDRYRRALSSNQRVVLSPEDVVTCGVSLNEGSSRDEPGICENVSLEVDIFNYEPKQAHIRKVQINRNDYVLYQ